MSILVVVLALLFWAVAFLALVGATIGIWMTICDHIKDRRTHKK